MMPTLGRWQAENRTKRNQALPADDRRVDDDVTNRPIGELHTGHASTAERAWQTLSVTIAGNGRFNVVGQLLFGEHRGFVAYLQEAC